ncbi:MAG: OmpA family protein [Myxococcales bacterium]|nr:OmpA family protein [Myxococcales bacterium]
MRLRPGWTAVVLLAFATAGCGIELRERARGVRAVIADARANGAYICAPKELAMAESHSDFLDEELSYGDYLAAKHELEVADENARRALELSPRDRCGPARKVAIIEVLDRDKDGVPDPSDECPDNPGPVELRGCPDLDKDGTLDRDDKCKKVPGPKENRGCPWPDTDGDGLLDKEDSCPKIPGPKENQGCPDGDRDGDKVVDRLDKCPDVPGEADNDGCPRYKNILVRDDKIELKQKVHFATNRFKIMPDSFAMLNEIADVLARRETMYVRIEGHTDGRAGLKFNMKLSQNRANAVKQYLVAKKAPFPRLEAVGFGPTRPIDDNRTAVGRENNRRVEFLITRQ